MAPDPNWDNDKKVRFLYMQVFDKLPRPIRDWINSDPQSVNTDLDDVAGIWNMCRQVGVPSTLNFLRHRSVTVRNHYRAQMGIGSNGKTFKDGYRVF